MKKLIIVSCCMALLLTSVTAQKPKVSIEEVKQQCEGLDFKKRVRLSVASFTVATPKANGEFGGELAEMLTNALQNVNCFNVLLSTKDLVDINEEIVAGQAGYTTSGSSPSAGKMKGAQVIVTGKITEFAQGESSGGALGIKFGSNKAKVGFVLKLINPETREIIDSKSINVEGSAGGFKGMTFLGIKTVGSTQNNKALADACEKGIIQAVEFIAASKDKMPYPDGGDPAAKKFDAANCTMLKGAYIPKIMVILPEFHITRRIPDPAGETEINRKLIEAGFQVIDPAIYATIKNSAKFVDAAKNPAEAISMGKQFGADIVIFGEAFSQLAGTTNGQTSCRARVEVRAVKTADAVMLAANGLEAGALDIAEFVAAKSALRSAAALTADYILDQFCSKNVSFAGKSAAAKPSAATKNTKLTEINVQNADYSKVKPLLDLLATKGKVVEKSIADGVAIIKFEHAGNVDVADLIDGKLGSKFSIKDLSDDKITIITK